MDNCCVLISSTIVPREGRDNSIVKSVHSSEERILQTRRTIESLQTLGYDNIYLFDNSGREYQETLESAFRNIHLKLFDHYQYDNKGISETFLMLEGIRYVPDNCPIIKLSGRYQIARRLELDTNNYDLAAKIYQHRGRLFRNTETMATRCYVLRNKAIYQSYLIGLLQEMYAYSSRIVGFGSLKRFLTNQFFSENNVYSFFDPSLSVEAASIRVIRNLNLKLCRLDAIGLNGLAGTFSNLLIED